MPQGDADGEGGQGRGTAAGRHLGDHVVSATAENSARVERGDARRGQRLGDAIVTAAPALGDADQGEAEQRRQDDAHFRRQIAFLDRVTHEEHGAASASVTAPTQTKARAPKRCSQPTCGGPATGTQGSAGAAGSAASATAGSGSNGGAVGGAMTSAGAH